MIVGYRKGKVHGLFRAAGDKYELMRDFVRVVNLFTAKL